MIDTIDVLPRSTPNFSGETYPSETDNNYHIFGTFLEFILYLIGTDVESYRHVFMTVTGHKEKDLMQFMIDRKTEMIRTFIVHRKDSHKVWFESAFGNHTCSSEDHTFPANEDEAFRNLVEVFHFAYKKEYKSLRLFEKVIESNLDAGVRTLMESAVEHQCRHIMSLDTRFSCLNDIVVPEDNLSNPENTNGQCALTIHNHNNYFIRDKESFSRNQRIVRNSSHVN